MYKPDGKDPIQYYAKGDKSVTAVLDSYKEDMILTLAKMTRRAGLDDDRFLFFISDILTETFKDMPDKIQAKAQCKLEDNIFNESFGKDLAKCRVLKQMYAHQRNFFLDIFYRLQYLQEELLKQAQMAQSRRTDYIEEIESMYAYLNENSPQPE